MKYIICYQEKIPRCEEIDANNERDAIHKLFEMIEKGTTIENLTGLGHNHEITSIRADNGDEFINVGHKLEQCRWQGHCFTEACKLGLINRGV